MPTERQLLTLRLTAAAIAVVTVGFAIGATIAAEAVRRDNRPEFQHLTGEMNLRAEPDVDSDTVRLLPTGTILRLGLPDHNGWAPAGDVRNRRIGYIYTRTDRVAEGLPDGLAVTSPVQAEHPAVQRVADACALDAAEATLLVRRTLARLHGAGYDDASSADVVRSILTYGSTSAVPLDCQEAGRLASAFPVR
jgi:hypothetical protein